MKFICACTAVGALLGTAAAYTQAAFGEDGKQAAPKTPYFLSKFDTRFRAADKDGDGMLSREEVQAAGMQRLLENFDQLDANHDGKLSREEIRALVRAKLSS